MERLDKICFLSDAWEYSGWQIDWYVCISHNMGENWRNDLNESYTTMLNKYIWKGNGNYIKINDCSFCAGRNEARVWWLYVWKFSVELWTHGSM